MTKDSSSRTIAGGCLCGAVRFEVDTPSRFCAHCHCGNCRRAHGAAFVTWAGFPEAQMRVVRGEGGLVDYPTDTKATRTFCGTCGSTLFFRSPRWAGEVHVVLANIDAPIDREPSGHVFVDHRAAWWEIRDALPQFGGPSGDQPKDPVD